MQCKSSARTTTKDQNSENPKSRHTTRWSLLWILHFKSILQFTQFLRNFFFFLSVFAEIMHKHFKYFIFSRFSTKNFHNFIELRNLNFISCFNPMISFLEFHFVHRSALYGFSKLLSINFEAEDLNSPWISLLVLWVFSVVVLCNARQIWIFWGASARRHTLGSLLHERRDISTKSLTVASSFRLKLNSLREKETKREQRFFLRRWRWCWFEFIFISIQSWVSCALREIFERENFNYEFMIIKWNRSDNLAGCLSHLISTREGWTHGVPPAEVDTARDQHRWPSTCTQRFSSCAK